MDFYDHETDFEHIFFRVRSNSIECFSLENQANKRKDDVTYHEIS